ncbi:hypothetical protein MHYP_G00212760 [Metynnis hypsauchen]
MPFPWQTGTADQALEKMQRVGFIETKETLGITSSHGTKERRTPPGGSRTGHIFNIDDKVTYRCNNKLKLLDSKVCVCQDGGQWSGQEPECYEDLFSSRCLSRAANILKDTFHPRHHLFDLLPSDQLL